MPGPEIDPFQLTGVFSVTPHYALPGQSIRYEVHYVSPGGLAPTEAEVEIDGVPHNMTAHGTSYATGVNFTYFTKTLTPGIHYYRYIFDDGSGAVTFEGTRLPDINSVTLTNPSVSPTTGDSTTPFTFQTTYTNSNGNVPTQADVYVNNVEYPMTEVSGSITTGAVHQATITLPNGAYSYAFVFGDGVTSWANPIAPMAFAGPAVGSATVPLGVPGSLIGIPTHTTDPDMRFVHDIGPDDTDS